MGACDRDRFRGTFAVIVVDAACGFAVHIDVMAGMLHGISRGVAGPFPEAGTASRGGLSGVPSFHHDVTLTAALILIVHTGLRRTF